MADDRLQTELEMDGKNLYLEEVFTDRRVGTIQRLTPVDGQGRPDQGRPVLYVGQTQLMSRMGALPLSFEIPAASLDEAAQKFAELANQAVEDTMQRLEELRREAASSIIVPEGGVPGAGGPGALGGAGGGKIRLP